MTKRNMIMKSNGIQKKINNNKISSIDMKLSDKIDKTLTIGSIHVETMLQGDLHNSPWSIKLSHRIKHVSYLRLVVSQLQTKTSYIKRLDRLSKELPLTYDKSYSSIKDAYKKRRDARNELRKTISNSTELRRQHLFSRATLMKFNCDYKKGRSIKQLITIKYQKSFNSSIKHHFNLTTISSISKIQIPIDNENWNNIPKDNSVKWKTITDSNVCKRYSSDET